MVVASSEGSSHREQIVPPAGHRVFILFYDADCGLCTVLRNWVHRLDVSRRIRSVPLAASEADSYLGDLEPSQRFGSMHIIGPDGGRSSGGSALLRLLEALPMGHGPSHLIANRTAGRAAAETVYNLLVRIRDGLAR